MDQPPPGRPLKLLNSHCVVKYCILFVDADWMVQTLRRTLH
jgi:hypothetical protein